MELLLALIPFVLIFLLLIVFRLPAVKAMPLVFLATLLLITTYWKITTDVLVASSLRAGLIFIELFLIILFAVLLINLYKESGMIKKIESSLASISPDYRVQAMLIAWAFVALIEGAAGFGTPVALAAPFLVMLGFPAVKAIIIGLIGDSTAVTFGAAGTPIIVGLSSAGLSGEEIANTVVTSALIHLPLAIIATLSISYVITRKTQGFKEFIPFSIFSALAFTIPYTLTAIFLGPELPSIIGGISAILLISMAGKYNFLTPKHVLSYKKDVKPVNLSHIGKPLIPFLVMILALVVTRNWSYLNEKLTSIELGFDNLLDTGISQALQPFYTPSFYFLLAMLIAIPLFGIKKKSINFAFSESLNKIKYAMITLVFVLLTAQFILYSDINTSGLEGITTVIANSLASVLGSNFIYFSPVLGALGTFVTGSSTVSNLLFASIQVDTALTIGTSSVLMASLQAIGSAAGNMFAIHNVVTATAVVGIKKGEGEIIKYNLFIAILYCLAAAVLAVLLF